MSKKSKIFKSLLLCFAAGLSLLSPSFVSSAESVPAVETSVSYAEAFVPVENETSEISLFSNNKTKEYESFPSELIPGGETFGVKFKASGVLVTDRQDIISSDGQEKNPAFDSGIKKGDIITGVDGEKIESGSDFRDKIAASGGKSVVLTVERNDKTQKIKVTPVLDSSDNTYHIGVIVKDSTAGLGTITFYDDDNMTFGALGHGICEGDTATLFPLEEGLVYSAKVYSVEKGVVGTPGELRGLFLDDTLLGRLSSNTLRGVFGSINSIPQKQSLKVAEPDEIKEGEVTILSTVDEKGVGEYSAEITKIDMSENDNKNFIIKITDSNLISKTGGIVQGMSGSPIIQNVKIIGAVTHVFINDPTSGYGIYIKNMPVS